MDMATIPATLIEKALKVSLQLLFFDVTSLERQQAYMC